VTSQAEVDRAASEERSTYGAAAEARALRAEAAELLAKTVVRAPFAGVLNDFDLEVADQVKAGMRIGELIDISRVEVDVGATEAELRVLRPGDAVQVQTDMHPERAVGGTIERIASAAHLVSRKFPVKVVAGNTAGLLLPGMVVRVVADAGDEEPRLWVPKQATVEEFGVSYVFVLRPVDDRLVAERRTITARPVAFRPAEVEVTSGLEHGERIAAGNLRELRDGTPVVIEEPL
jgi:RND family efflux transporter MFP subunit